MPTFPLDGRRTYEQIDILIFSVLLAILFTIVTHGQQWSSLLNKDLHDDSSNYSGLFMFPCFLNAGHV